MAGSVNKCILIGNLGRDPEIRSTQDGKKIATLSLAVSETWRDKVSGERKERTEWVRVVVFNEKLAGVAEKYLHKGAKIYIEGALETRKWTDKDGQERNTTEVVIKNFRGELTMLDGRGSNESPSPLLGAGDYGGYEDAYAAGNARSSERPSAGFGGKPGMRETSATTRTPVNDLDDDIPF